MDIKVSNQSTGEYTLTTVENLVQDCTYYGIPAEETQDWKAAAAALEAQDWDTVASISSKLQMDIEIV